MADKKNTNIVAKNVTVNQTVNQTASSSSSSASSKSSNKKLNTSTSSNTSSNVSETNEKKIDTKPTQEKSSDENQKEILYNLTKIYEVFERSDRYSAKKAEVDDAILKVAKEADPDKFNQLAEALLSKQEQTAASSSASTPPKKEKTPAEIAAENNIKEQTDKLTQTLKEYDEFIKKKTEKNANKSVVSDSAKAVYSAGTNARGFTGGARMLGVGLASALGPALGNTVHLLLSDHFMGFTKSIFGSITGTIKAKREEAKKEAALQNEIIELLNNNVADLTVVAEKTKFLKNVSLETFTGTTPQTNEAALFKENKVMGFSNTGGVASKFAGFATEQGLTVRAENKEVVAGLQGVRDAVNTSAERTNAALDKNNNQLAVVSENTKKTKKTGSELAQESLSNEKKLFSGKTISNAAKKTKDWVGALFSLFKKSFLGLMGILFIYFSSDQFKTWLMDKITHPFKKIWSGIKGLFGDDKKGALSKIVSGFGGAALVVAGLTVAVKSLLAPLKLFKTLLLDLPMLLGKLGFKGAKLAGKAIGKGARLAKRGFDFVKKGKSAGNAAKKGKGLFSSIKGAVSGKAKAIGNAIKGKVNSIKKLGGNIKKGFKAAKSIGKGVASFIKSGGKNLLKKGAKIFSKGALKSGVKKVPILGAVAGTAFAVERFLSGDKLGALGEFASGIASIFPGAGTAVSTAIDATMMARDAQKELSKSAEDTKVIADSVKKEEKAQKKVVEAKASEIKSYVIEKKPDPKKEKIQSAYNLKVTQNKVKGYTQVEGNTYGFGTYNAFGEKNHVSDIIYVENKDSKGDRLFPNEKELSDVPFVYAKDSSQMEAFKEGDKFYFNFRGMEERTRGGRKVYREISEKDIREYKDPKGEYNKAYHILQRMLDTFERMEQNQREGNNRTSIAIGGNTSSATLVNG